MQSLENTRGEYYELPRGLFVAGFGRPRLVQVVTGGNGSVVTRNRLMPARGEIQGVLKARSYLRAQEALDDLLGFLHFAPLKFRRHGTTGRYLLVLPEATSDDGTTIARLPSLRIPLVAPDPLWWGESAAHGPVSVAGTLAEVTLTNAGTAPTPLTVILTGVGSPGSYSPGVENLTTGQGATYNSPLLNSQVVTVDGLAHAATRAPASNPTDVVGVNDLMSNQFLVGGLDLAPGINNFLIKQLAGSSGVSVTFTWAERYY